MKKKRIIAGALATCLALPMVFGLSGCGKDPINVNAKDIYAMAAMASVEYLEDTAASAAASATHNRSFVTEPTRPISLEDVKSIKGCLDLFEGLLSNGGVDQTTTTNTMTQDDDPELYQYKLVMTISLPDVMGADPMTFYYNEINTKTREEIDDGEVELKVSTELAGVMTYNGHKYIMEGKRVFEREGNEEEATIEFKTFATNSGIKDEDNYIVVSQSVENNELEYEYSVINEGQEVLEVELELERKRGTTVIEFETEVEGSRQETEYKVIKKDNEDTFTAYAKINGKRKKIVITPTANGYTFEYTNGFSEPVNG